IGMLVILFLLAAGVVLEWPKIKSMMEARKGTPAAVPTTNHPTKVASNIPETTTTLKAPVAATGSKESTQKKDDIKVSDIKPTNGGHASVDVSSSAAPPATAEEWTKLSDARLKGILLLGGDNVPVLTQAITEAAKRNLVGLPELLVGLASHPNY